MSIEGTNGLPRAACFHRGDATALAAAVVRRPTALVALAVLVLNDHLFKARWPGVVTGKLSDVVWPIVAVPLVALLLAPLALPAGRQRWALTATVLTAAPFVAINLSPDAADGAARLLTSIVGPSVVTVDPTDLLVLPVFLLPLRWLQHDAIPPPRPAGRIGPLGLVILGLATLGTAATSCDDDRPRVDRLGTDDDGQLLALLGRFSDRPELARSTDGGLTWERDPRAPTSWPEGRDPAFTAVVERLRDLGGRTEACGDEVCFRLDPDDHGTIERASEGTVETLALTDPRREEARRRELDAHTCPLASGPRSSDLEVVTTPEGGDRAVVARGLEGVVLVDEAGVRPISVLGASPPDQGEVTFAVIAPEVATVTLVAAIAWTARSASWWGILTSIAVGLSTLSRASGRSGSVTIVASVVVAVIVWLPLAALAGPSSATLVAAGFLGTAVAIAWLTVPVPRGWRSVPWRLAAQIGLPWLVALAMISAWSAGWLRSYGVMLVAATVLAVGASRLARRVAPLPSTGPPAPEGADDDR